MQKKAKCFGHSFLLMLLFSLTSVSVPMPALDLPALTKDSACIVVGEVISTRDLGYGVFSLQGHSLECRRELAELRVSRVLKGQISASQIAIETIRSKIFVGFRDVMNGQFGMFFLTLKSGNVFVPTDNYYPFLVAARSDASATGDDFERVIAEIAHALTSAETTIAEKIQAIDSFARIDKPSVIQALKLAASNQNTKVKLQAVAALLERNDISYLKVAESALLDPSANIDQIAIARLNSGIEKVTDSKAIPILARLLKSPSPRTRQVAAYALRRTKHNVAIKPLVSALYDSDQRVRYHAVMGLSAITNEAPQGPSIGKYEANEQKYLNLWKEWGKKQGIK